jgi:hypothetical protein
MFVCKRCGYSTPRKDLLIKHLEKKFICKPLLANIDVNELLDGDAEAILIFLRNTAFGSDYNFILKDPKTGKDFETKIALDELNIQKAKITPNDKGLFEFNLPRTGVNVVCKLLNIQETNELSELPNLYPDGVTVPIITKRLEKIIVSIDGDENREKISTFISTLPIMDSKFIRNTISDCEPKLDLNRTTTAPSGEKVNMRITFGAEFFRPFF